MSYSSCTNAFSGASKIKVKLGWAITAQRPVHSMSLGSGSHLRLKAPVVAASPAKARLHLIGDAHPSRLAHHLQGTRDMGANACSWSMQGSADLSTL